MNEDKLDLLVKEKDTPVQRTDYMVFIRNITVVLAFVLMIAVSVFQWLEIQEYNIQDDMFERIGNMFKSEEVEEDSAPEAEENTASDGETKEGSENNNNSEASESE